RARRPICRAARADHVAAVVEGDGLTRRVASSERPEIGHHTPPPDEGMALLAGLCDLREIARADDLARGVDRGRSAAREARPERPEIGHLPALPEERVLCSVGRRAGAHDLAPLVDAGG